MSDVIIIAVSIMGSKIGLRWKAVSSLHRIDVVDRQGRGVQ